MQSNNSALGDRKYILDKLEAYQGVNEDEDRMRQDTIDFIRKNPDCFMRTLLIGHVNGSAWIVDRDYKYVLLTHHTKLGKWLQLGGHSDGNFNTLEVATREAWEESGLKSIAIVSEDIFDVDIHSIPVKGDEPEHKHYDIRFLFTADRNEPLLISSESKDLQWVAIDNVKDLNSSESLVRMVRKTAQ